MPGVQRSTVTVAVAVTVAVTVAAGELQRKGMIGYSRGRIQILDRPQLQGVACECYTIVRSAYERLLTKSAGGTTFYVL